MYFVIQDWMITALHLKGSELLVYAIIYGYSQRMQGCFYGSASFLAETLGVGRRTIFDCLSSLTERGLLRKTEEIKAGVKICSYEAIAPDCIPSAEIAQGSAKIAQGGSAEIAPNNKVIDNKRDNKTNPLNNIPLPYSSEKFVSTWRTLCQQPKWRKKSHDALEANAKMLGEYPEAVALKMMQNTLRNDWQGLFPLKDWEMPKAERETAQSRAHEAFLRVAKETGVVSKFLNINVPPES